MFSKLVRASVKQLWRVPPRPVAQAIAPVRQYSDIMPPTQYDIPIPKKLQIGHVLKEYWETIPLFLTTFTSIALVVVAIIYAARNKVDIVFSTHNRENISRTMDLRNPSVHKVITINQRYEPWPEMQDVLDKMKMAEKRALVRAQSCNHP
ncbi:uncharacterized protein LOC114351330 [Ostrinia furnacalis]|uniref:uncharacterized protein LOC114351330 n=1 Tax=Ostrinia furnacalis TaxID=93504 RepID=UPI001040DA26|nr:uncharacterized protein LOC114351330 [Ostrinia furnacalis]